MSSSENKTPSDTAAKNDSSTATAATTNLKPELAMEAIEEDDEFEEFQDANWGKGDEDAEDTQQWQDNWDVDDMDDDFTKNLREELMKNSQ
jgi:26 proteasome complex subunit DSS1